MNLSNLKDVVQQVADSETYKNVDFVNVVQDNINKLLLSVEDPPNYDSPDVSIDLNNATITVKDGIDL